MILTVTLNPAIDKTIEVCGFKLGGLNKVITVHQDPGGKGINVSKVVKALGGESLATGILGDGPLETALDALEIQHDFVKVSGQTRTNLKVFDSTTGETTEINEQGPEVDSFSVDAMLDKIAQISQEISIAVISGSAPKTLPRDIYGILIRRLKALGIKVFLDAEGELFSLALAEKPHAIKPNRHELELYFNRVLSSNKSLSEAAHFFREKGIEEVYISLGSEGAYYLGNEGEYYLNPLKIKAHSSVGAGDAFVGAIVYAKEQAYPVEERLKLAVVSSAGAVMTIGTKPMSREWIWNHVQAVQLTRIESEVPKA